MSVLCIKCGTKNVSTKRQLEGKRLCSYCSSQIKADIRRKGVNRETGQSLYFKKPCEHCGETFLGNKKTKYCSKNCAKKADKKNKKIYFSSKKYKEKRKIQRKKSIEEKKCVVCNKKFETNKSKVVCCSDECKKFRVCEQVKSYYWRKKNGN